MRPVLVLQNLNGDGPAFLAEWLRRRGVPYRVFNTDAGDEYPASMGDYAALALLGGEMSANDALPSLRRAETLILDAMTADKPVIGHCLGGQLIARAVGARIVDSPAPEVGWQPITVDDSAAARDWFGAPGPVRVFQWHYEAFELPRQATLLAASAACPHQAFTIGPHLAMQFHIEVDAEKVERWSREEAPRWLLARQHHAATVQDGAAIRDAVAGELLRHQALANRLYSRWLEGVVRR